MTKTPKAETVPAEKLLLGDGTHLAYHRTPGCCPGVVFLGGFTSDMTGTKALALEDHCRETGRAYVRFDYFGHGCSDGAFVDATIGRWAADAVAVIDRLTDGPQILVGSSMGGWIMVLAALERPERVAGLVGIASAPDFTEELVWTRFDAGARERLRTEGVVEVPSQYGEGRTPIAWRLVEEARQHLVLGGAIPLECPVRLLHGMDDPDVPWRTSVRLAQALRSLDVRTILIKDGGHRLSRPADLALITSAFEDLCRGNRSPDVSSPSPSL